MSTFGSHPEGSFKTQKSVLSKRLEDTGWALFLILIGALLLVPEGRVPQGTWLIGTGIIMLGVNGVRYLNGITMSGFTVVLGALALVAGLANFFGVELPFFAAFLIFMGMGIILRPLLERR